jgi:hypothetical protein
VKKYMVMVMTACMVVLGSYCGMAAESISTSMTIRKSVTGTGEVYSANLQVIGNNIRRLSIQTPKKKMMVLNNILSLNDLTFAAKDLSYDSFKIQFPQGEYTLAYTMVKSPKQWRKFKILHAFPDVPAVTFPSEGAKDVPLDATLTWSDQPDLYWSLYLEGMSGPGAGAFNYVFLFPGATSHGMSLEAATEYEVKICGCRGDASTWGVWKSTETCTTVTFTTADTET